ncbi:CDP-glycerol glycerophosphotransferase family protein [Helicobacter mesocricetorum]|uniref:CDP-glycerol glycerophosphotransferase family protein n=1 Tax=Helicobacter mesocricetorum TaxID=87012 RepID=UPI001F3ACCB5|nr:CDP-glycerol glycerophosphotransferase family protein [Helicobacter mesocricetorum]
MNIQEQINVFITQAKSKIQSHLSNEKKNILVIAYYPVYRKHFGDLIKKLKQDYNVITIVDRILNDEFESSGNANVLFPWRLVENGETYYLNAEIPNIDLILTADQVGYEEGRIDREFLSKTAKRIYFPHSLIEATGNPLVVDYILSPTAITTQTYKKNKKGAKILNVGYPKFDKSLEEYRETPLNTITYAPLLRYVDENNNVYVNLFAGYENNLIEWLLENTDYKVSYRAHPFNVCANHGYYQLIKENWHNEERVSFDEALGSGFYNFSDFVLSDYSSSAYTFALTTLKPSFFYKPHKTNSNLEKYIPYVCGGGGQVCKDIKGIKRTDRFL